MRANWKTEPDDSPEEQLQRALDKWQAEMRQLEIEHARKIAAINRWERIAIRTVIIGGLAFVMSPFVVFLIRRWME